MIYRLIMQIAAATAITLLAAAAAAADGTAGNRYFNEQHGYSVELPDGWTIGQNPVPGNDLLATSPKDVTSAEYEANMTVTAQALPLEMTLDQYTSAMVEMLPTLAPGFALVDEGKMKINGADAKYIIYTAVLRDATLKSAYVVTMKGAMVVAMSYNTSAQLYPSYEKLFEKSAESFRFEDAAGLAALARQAETQAAASAARPGVRQYVKNAGFSIAVPEGWTVMAKPVGGADFAVSGPAGAGFTVTTARYPGKADLNTYSAAGFDAAKTGIPSFAQVSAGTMTVDNMPAKTVIYTREDSGAKLKCLAVYMVKDDRAATLTFTAPADRYGDYGKTFAATATSFKFEAPRGPAVDSTAK